MHILITDSGVGGLSVCAYAERFLRTAGIKEPVRLTYVNASPENDFGYNSMGSRQEKLEFFDRFLGIVANRYAPDLMYVACNTLSVLLADTTFVAEGRVPVQGIVESGVNRLVRELDRKPDSRVAIFGTVTTIDEGTYPRRLQQRGIEAKRIIAQACPSLADTISEDRQGRAVREKIKRYVGETIEKSEGAMGDHLTYLACTHYGYRKALFSDVFKQHNIDTEILNPNEFVAEELFESLEGGAAGCGAGENIEVEFVTRYRIPDAALETIAFFLEPISPRTIKAFQKYTYDPGLF